MEQVQGMVPGCSAGYWHPVKTLKRAAASVTVQVIQAGAPMLRLTETNRKGEDEGLLFLWRQHLGVRG